MEYSIGNIIRSERKKRGWDQAELVHRLGGFVQQQAVSGWERGVSRPTREMIFLLSKAFEIEEASLLAKAGYTEGPVRPLLTTLPLERLSFEQFEQFSADLIAYIHFGEGIAIDRYGSQGHKQKGADIIVTKNGKRGKEEIYQCKRVKQFGPGAVKKAVETTSLVAKKYRILLTRVATPDALEEIGKYKNWAIWDIEKISQLVRALPREQALHLVETYFPGGWRKDFLGFDEPGPWTTPEDFFKNSSGNQLYTHKWKLVGQEKSLEGIKKFLSDAPDEQQPEVLPKVGVISGRGGSGKTRLLREVASLAKNDSGYEVRFLGNGQNPTPASYELLLEIPKLLVIIDDAHERSDMAVILDGIHKIQPTAKVIIALRPYGFSQLTSDLRRISVHPSEFPCWEIKEIKFQDAEKLAQEVLGKDVDPRITRRLAHLTNDCPLLTVVGAGLVKRGELDVFRLENDASIKGTILSHFRDTFIEDSGQGNPAVLRAVLNAISALQPFPLNDGSFREALEKLCGHHWDELMPYIKRLEEKGVLLRRGRSLRIVPDLLGDAILSEACFDSQSSISTGYIERIHRELKDKALQNLIVNAARVDWQINASNPDSQSLVEFLWPTITAEFQASGYDGRLEIMKLLKKVAFFQPEQSLALIRSAIEQPILKKKGSPEESQDDEFSINYEYVLNAIPPVLKQIAYNVDFLKEAMDILWILSQRDNRSTNQYPDHPLRVLQELASYERWKPAFFNEEIVAIAKRWFEKEEVAIHSPFDVLDALLATESSETFSEGATMTFRPFSVRFDAVKKIRESVINIAFLEARLPDVKRATRAIKALGEGTQYPVGMFNRIVTDKERDLWTPSFLETIKRLGKFGTMPSLDPELLIAIRQALQWHSKHSPTSTKQAAKEALKGLPNNTEHQLALALHSGWGDLVFDHISDFKLRDERRQNWYKELVANLIVEYSDEEIMDLLEKRLEAQAQASDRGFPNPFIWTLIGERPALGKIICQRIISNQSLVLSGILPIVFSQMMEHGQEEALALVPDLLSTKSFPVIRSIAYALGWNRGNREGLSDKEFELLTTLAAYSDQDIRSALIKVIPSIGEKHREKAIELTSLIKFGDSFQVTKEFFSVFGKHGILKLEELGPEQKEAIWEQLKIAPSIDDYSITEFLSDVSRENPSTVLDLLRARVEYDEEHPEIKGFRALPFHWDHDLQFRGQPNFPQLLREIRNWIAEKPDSWARMVEGARLFQRVAGEFNDQVLGILEEGIHSGLPNQLEAVAYILREAPEDLVWSNVNFIEHILEMAHAQGEERLRRVSSSLISAVESGVRSGVYGEPFKKDVDQREKALKIADSFLPGSLTEKFYRTLARSAENNINWHSESNEKITDSREW